MVGKNKKVRMGRLFIRLYQVVILALLFKRAYKQAAPAFQYLNNLTLAPLTSSLLKQLGFYQVVLQSRTQMFGRNTDILIEGFNNQIARSAPADIDFSGHDIAAISGCSGICQLQGSSLSFYNPITVKQTVDRAF